LLLLRNVHNSNFVHSLVVFLSPYVFTCLGQDPWSQAGRQSDGYCGWCLEFRQL